MSQKSSTFISSSPVRALIFDLDRTICDVESNVQAGFEALQRSWGNFRWLPMRQLMEKWREAQREVMRQDSQQLARSKHSVPMSLGFETLIHRLNTGFNQPTWEELATMKMSFVLIARQNPITAMPTSIETLKELVNRGFVLGLITNGRANTQQQKCDDLGITRYFNCITVSETAGAYKPERQIFDMTLEKLGVSAAEAIMVGDSMDADVEGARNANIRPIFFAPERQACEGKLHREGVKIIRQISDLLAMKELAAIPAKQQPFRAVVSVIKDTKPEALDGLSNDWVCLSDLDHDKTSPFEPATYLKNLSAEKANKLSEGDVAEDLVDGWVAVLSGSATLELATSSSPPENPEPGTLCAQSLDDFPGPSTFTKQDLPKTAEQLRYFLPKSGITIPDLTKRFVISGRDQERRLVSMLMTIAFYNEETKILQPRPLDPIPDVSASFAKLKVSDSTQKVETSAPVREVTHAPKRRPCPRTAEELKPLIPSSGIILGDLVQQFEVNSKVQQSQLIAMVNEVATYEAATKFVFLRPIERESRVPTATAKRKAREITKS